MTILDPTEIRVNEHGNETHESWLLIRANRVSSHPGARLFDSEIAHQHFIRVTVNRCTRKRDLNRDWLYDRQGLIEIDMSEAQWGAFVSSFGSSGVPATLSSFNGEMVPGVTTIDSRLNKSHQEIRSASAKAVEAVQLAQAEVDEAFERGAGKKEMREKLRTLKIVTGNLPTNMEFAAMSLTEHTEAVVTKARSDIEAMVYQAAKQGTQLDSMALHMLDGPTVEDCLTYPGVHSNPHRGCPDTAR